MVFSPQGQDLKGVGFFRKLSWAILSKRNEALKWGYAEIYQIAAIAEIWHATPLRLQNRRNLQRRDLN
jgi:hypothetical protein